MGADAELEATAAIARDLIRFETVNWGGGRSKGETEAAEYVAAKLESLGLEAAAVRLRARTHERRRPRAGPRP